VDPIGAVTNERMFATDDIMIAPGHTIVDLRVDNVIDHSSWSVAVEDPEEKLTRQFTKSQPRQSMIAGAFCM